MIVSTKGNNEITKLLNDWYLEIRSRRIGNAHQLKEIIDSKIHSIEEDQNLLLYYSQRRTKTRKRFTINAKTTKTLTTFLG